MTVEIHVPEMGESIAEVRLGQWLKQDGDWVERDDLLVEIESGDVLAAASWHRNVQNQKNASFTPYQSVFEPGSIVKPLVLGYAYESGTLDWDHVYDCRLDSRDYRQTISGLGRRKKVRDDHDCGELTAHGILVNSSNIGATLIGLGLAREQWRGPLGAYPHSGGFIMPNWQFEDIMSPEDYLAEAKTWVQMGVQVIGGCCGTTPEHIRLLKAGLPTHVPSG